MKTSLFDYDLPENLIARHPTAVREASRLMRVERVSGSISHHVFSEFPRLLRKDDLLVFNDTRVFPARLLGRRRPDGGKVEALLLYPAEETRWWALVKPGKKIREGDRLVFAPGRLEATVEEYGKRGGGERLLRFEYTGDWWELLQEVGHTPLPPYILKARERDAGGASPEEAQDKERYQTVFAGPERASVAAPTAGLHFSPAVLGEMDALGVERTFIQLHVGPGTFQPVKTEEIEQHPMHEEYFRIPGEAAEQLNRARADKRRIVAVGTTVVRALETAALVAKGKADEIFRSDSEDRLKPRAGTRELRTGGGGLVQPLSGWTRVLIAPGFFFEATDALLTNFHLPHSTLLALVSAFAGQEDILGAYREAIRLEYRFFSYGDCMLIE